MPKVPASSGRVVNAAPLTRPGERVIGLLG
jgi:hypothetical protein